MSANAAYFENEMSRLRRIMAELIADNKAGYREAFSSLQGVGTQRSKKASLNRANSFKNRYGDITSYDHSRVKLSNRFHKGDNDYMNANYISFSVGSGKASKQSAPAAIAAQGPMRETIHTFWQMVWENNCRTIIMLTPLLEKGKLKCDRYWPVKTSGVAPSGTYGDFVITLVSEIERNTNYVERSFIVTLRDPKFGGEQREVRQYAFTQWPDHGVPSSTYEIIDMFWAVKSKIFCDDVEAPPLVHCSAGVGRTGVFCVLDRIITLAAARQPLDVDDMVRQLRQCRNLMVQTIDQYAFCHRLVSICTFNHKLTPHYLQLITFHIAWDFSNESFRYLPHCT